MTDSTPKLKVLHSLYCSLTGRAVTFDMPALYRWEQWSARGWTEKDLELVVKFLKKKIELGARKQESFRLHNLIDVARFEDDLVDARGQQRKPKVNRARTRVLEQTGRSGESPEQPAEAAGAVLERTKLAQQLKEWREKNL